MSRAAIGSIAGSSAPRADHRPNMRGAGLAGRMALCLVEADRRLHFDRCGDRRQRRPAQKFAKAMERHSHAKQIAVEPFGPKSRQRSRIVRVKADNLGRSA
jgi:hypothetical protein